MPQNLHDLLLIGLGLLQLGQLTTSLSVAAWPSLLLSRADGRGGAANDEAELLPLPAGIFNDAVASLPLIRIESVVSWCERGPRGAVVEGVDVSWEAPEGLRGFDIY